MMHSFFGDVDNLVDVGARRDERRGEAEDVAMRHGAGDKAAIARSL